MTRMYAKHRQAWIYRSIRACHAEALAKAGPLACLVGKTFPRFGCIALRAYLFSATDAGSFKPGATPQGNVAREDERCSDLSFDVEAVRESGGEDGKRRVRHVGKIGRRRYGYLGQLWPGSRTRPQMNYR